MKDTRFDELFRKLLNRTATAAEKKELRHLWSAEKGHSDPDQLFAYQDWQHTAGEGPLPVVLEQKVLNYILSQEAPPSISPLPKRTALRWLPAAAAAILLFIVAGYWMWQNRSAKEANPLQIVSTAFGERKKLSLTDGSIVYLNGGATVHFPKHFDGKQRMISLEGEAFFEISRDSTRPFIVQTGNVATTVLGTSFNIATRSEDTSITVSVKTGKVLVATKNNRGEKPEELRLLPGMQANYNGRQNKLVLSGIVAENAGSWKDNLLIFKNASLEEICLALERKYGVRFTPSTPALLRCRFSTRFEGLTLQESLDKLSILGDLHFFRKDNMINIEGSACTP